MPRVGEVIDNKYRLDRLLGRGGWGVVFAAKHLSLNHSVAIKFLEADIADNDAAARARFVREARAAVRLQSEFVARVLDVGETPLPYIVLEYVAGVDLKAHLRKNGPLAIGEACECIVHACHALADAHTKGIIHRDVKPGNMMLTRDASDLPHVKVLDFGISKALRSDEAAGGGSTGETTSSSLMLGTPHYMSPEQLKSSTNVDHRTDIWALGITLYELLTGELPFYSDNLAVLMASVTRGATPSADEIRPDLPKELATIIKRCLAKRPGARFESCAELARALAPFCPPRTAAIIDKTTRLTNVRARIASDEHTATTPHMVAPRKPPQPSSEPPPPTTKKEIKGSGGLRVDKEDESEGGDEAAALSSDNVTSPNPIVPCVPGVPGVLGVPGVPGVVVGDETTMLSSRPNDADLEPGPPPAVIVRELARDEHGEILDETVPNPLPMLAPEQRPAQMAGRASSVAPPPPPPMLTPRSSQIPSTPFVASGATHSPASSSGTHQSRLNTISAVAVALVLLTAMGFGTLAIYRSRTTHVDAFPSTTMTSTTIPIPSESPPPVPTLTTTTAAAAPLSPGSKAPETPTPPVTPPTTITIATAKQRPPHPTGGGLPPAKSATRPPGPVVTTPAVVVSGLPAVRD